MNIRTNLIKNEIESKQLKTLNQPSLNQHFVFWMMIEIKMNTYKILSTLWTIYHQTIIASICFESKIQTTTNTKK